MKTMNSLSENFQDQYLVDSKLIDINDGVEIMNWSFALKVSPVELRQAVAKVGPSAARVREHFGLSEY